MEADKVKYSRSKSHHKSRKSRSQHDGNVQSLLDAIFHAQVEKVREILFTPQGNKSSDKAVDLTYIRDVSSLPILCVEGAISAQTSDADGSPWIECLRLLSSADIPLDSQDRDGRTALHVAVRHKQYDIVKELLQLSSKVDQQNVDGFNCFHIAISVGDTRMVEYLLQVLPSQTLDLVDNFGRTPLYLALLNGSLDLFECLLSGGCDPNSIGPDGRPIIFHVMEKNLSLHLQQLIQHSAALETVNGFTAVHFAACQENSENIRTLSSVLSEDLLCAKDKEGKTPLMYVAMMGLDQNLKFLLEANIVILQQDNEGKTALHYTATNTHRGCVDLLCKQDPSITSISDINGNSPGHDAIMAQNETVLKAVIENGLDYNSCDNEKHSLVHWATVYNSYAGLETLIKVGASVNSQDNTGASPLHYACQLEEDSTMVDTRNQILQLLLANSAHIEAVDNNGRRPIHWAGSSGNRASLEYLARKGATIDVGTSSEKLTALHLACSQGYSDCVQFLVENSSASVNLLDSTGCSPLFYACAIGDVKSVKVLLKAGANPDLRSVDGKRPLHCAASQKVVECLSLLIEAGAELSPQGCQGDTPLHEASSTGQGDCVLYLLKQGCPPDIPNRFGATPLHYAVAENHQTVIEHLLARGAKVNTIFPTGSENNYVSPLDIALGNGDYSCVKLLQSVGGRTGHSIVQNAAIAIQHSWKSYKERKTKSETGLDPEKEGVRSRRSTLSESVSVRDEKELKDAECGFHDDLAGNVENTFGESIQERLHSLDLDNSRTYDGHEPSSWTTLEKQKSDDGSLFCPSKKEQSFIIDEDTMQSIRRQRAQGRKAMNEMRRFLLYAENLREDFNRVAREAKDLVDSEDFMIVKSYNLRMRQRRSSGKRHLGVVKENEVTGTSSDRF